MISTKGSKIKGEHNNHYYFRFNIPSLHLPSTFIPLSDRNFERCQYYRPCLSLSRTKFKRAIKRLYGVSLCRLILWTVDEKVTRCMNDEWFDCRYRESFVFVTTPDERFVQDDGFRLKPNIADLRRYTEHMLALFHRLRIPHYVIDDVTLEDRCNSVIRCIQNSRTRDQSSSKSGGQHCRQIEDNNKKAVLSQRCPRDAQSDNTHMV